jgi:uncharacterized membrane protein (UPF0127 family)
MRKALFIVVLTSIIGLSAVAGAFYTYEEPDVSIETKLSLDTVHLACTQGEKQTGLSTFDSLPSDEGMLFPYQNEQKISIWMKDMDFRIDAVWIDAQGKITTIERDIPLCGTDCSFSGRGKYLLELNAGTAEAHNLKQGDHVAINTACSSDTG